MARTQTMVQLSDELLKALDRTASSRGASRSALIRELLWESLSEDRERQIGEQIAEGYRRIPQGAPDEWKDVSDANRRSNQAMLQRLEAEERAAGFSDPW